MKTSIKSLIIALALGTTVAFAGPGSDAKKPTTFETGIYKTMDGSLTVNVVKKAPAFATVAILNHKGEVLAREGMSKKQDKASIKFDVSNLQDGEYTVMVVSKGEREAKQFTITSEKLITARTISFE